jgi:hypothetical protein
MDGGDQHQSRLAVQHDRLVIEGMRERKFGRIINISSINGHKGQFGQTNYSAAKAGEIGFTKALAQECARVGVTVNAIAPGYINIEMVQAVPKDVLENSILPTIPIGRLGEPEEIGRCVVFLTADDAGLITGSTPTEFSSVDPAGTWVLRLGLPPAAVAARRRAAGVADVQRRAVVAARRCAAGVADVRRRAAVESEAWASMPAASMDERPWHRMVGHRRWCLYARGFPGRPSCRERLPPGRPSPRER